MSPDDRHQRTGFIPLRERPLTPQQEARLKAREEAEQEAVDRIANQALWLLKQAAAQATAPIHAFIPVEDPSIARRVISHFFRARYEGLVDDVARGGNVRHTTSLDSFTNDFIVKEGNAEIMSGFPVDGLLFQATPEAVTRVDAIYTQQRRAEAAAAKGQPAPGG
jgi:hypothetical protein